MKISEADFAILLGVLRKIHGEEWTGRLRVLEVQWETLGLPVEERAKRLLALANRVWAVNLMSRDDRQPVRTWLVNATSFQEAEKLVEPCPEGYYVSASLVELELGPWEL